MSSNEDSNSQFGAYYNASMPVSRRFDGEKNRQAATNGSSNAPEKTDHLTAVHVLAHPGCLSSLKDHHIPQLVPNDGPYWTTPPPSPHASDGDEQVIAVPALGYLQNASLPNTVHLQGFPVESDKDANGEGKTSTATKSSRYEL